MAHILVYLQRTPTGLHPASALGLCVARDIASNRGASVTALCPGDAGTLDAGITRAAGRFGADLMVYLGVDGLVETVKRLGPVHLIAPWTPEGLGAVADTPLGPPIPRWVARARPPGAGADTVTGVVAGALPWHAFDAGLEPEYLGEVDDVALPPWVASAGEACSDAEAPGFSMVPKGALHFVADDSTLSAELRRTLEQLGAAPLQPGEVEAVSEGTVLWFCEGAGVLPEALASRPAAARCVAFPGTEGSFDPSWMHADLVVPGPLERAVARLHEPLWRAALA